MSAGAPNFHYRYVGFGTVFTPASGLRTDDTTAPTLLHENEIAVDVGGHCFDDPSDTRLFVFDHHFKREPPDANFPAAATAVLHYAAAIHGHCAEHDDIWLVAHEQPDFDAFCAMFLARCVIEEPDTVEAIGRCNLQEWPRSAWLNPQITTVDAVTRALVLLAAYAANVDQANRMRAPRTRALHSVLYAAMVRGRPLRADGARVLFNAARAAIFEKGLNPLFDAVFDDESPFRPELTLLDREEDAYGRDIARARRCIVNLQTNAEEFSAWFGRVATHPLRRADGTIHPMHLQPSGPATVQADGIYLKDPESILFKEWARGDHENSSFGRGFLFTAIAYTHPNARRYWFSLDLERARAERCHLYNVWSALQDAEIRARVAAGDSRLGETGKRQEFLSRDVGADPWYDGNAFEATIIDTPRRGSALAQGRRSDLSDDAPAQIVRKCLEYSWFEEPVAQGEDFPAEPHAATSEQARLKVDLTHAVDQEPPHDCLRFFSVAVREGVDLLRFQNAEQIGRMLWPLLERKSVTTVPGDFAKRHLVVDRDTVTVWSRRGIAVAYRGESGAAQSQQLEAAVRKMAGIRLAVKQILKSEDATANEAILMRSEHLARSLAEIHLDAARPERTALRRFFEANHFNDVLDTARDLNRQAIERARQARDTETTTRMDANLHTIAHVQTMVEWIEIFLVSVYAAELAHALWEKAHLVVASAAALGAALTAWGVLPTTKQKVGVTVIAFLALAGAVPFLEHQVHAVDHVLEEWHMHGFHGVIPEVKTFLALARSVWVVAILGAIILVVRSLRSRQPGTAIIEPQRGGAARKWHFTRRGADARKE